LGQSRELVLSLGEALLQPGGPFTRTGWGSSKSASEMNQHFGKAILPKGILDGNRQENSGSDASCQMADPAGEVERPFAHVYKAALGRHSQEDIWPPQEFFGDPQELESTPDGVLGHAEEPKPPEEAILGQHRRIDRREGVGRKSGFSVPDRSKDPTTKRGSSPGSPEFLSEAMPRRLGLARDALRGSGGGDGAEYMR
jgi:hypothetical protein